MRRLLIVAALLAAAASPAAAQPAPWAPERFTAGWIFTPSAVFGGLWDSNVTVRNEVDPTVTPEVVGLFSPRGEIDFNGRRAKFNAGYSGTLEAYRTIDELTRYDQRGRLDARYQMTPRLLFQTRHQLTLSPTTDQLELGAVPFTRVGSRLLDSRGGFTFEMSPRTVITTDYYFQWVDFDRDPRFALLEGGHSHSPSVELKFALTRRLDVGGVWTYRHALIDGAEQIIDTQHALGVVQYAVAPNTKVRGSAGLAHLSISDTPETRTGPSFGAAVEHKVNQATFDAGFERSFVPSFGFGGMTANQMVFARGYLPFARGRLFTSGSFVYRRSEPVLAVGLDIQLDSSWTQAAVGYYIARWARVEGFYALTHQTSSAQGNVNRTRVGVQFVTSKPVRIQ